MAPQGGAHTIHLFATVEGSTITGRAYFPSGPAKDVPVRAYDLQGALLGETRTDDAGAFTLPVQKHCDHKLVVETEDGHRAEFAVSAGELTGESSAPAEATASPARADAAPQPPQTSATPTAVPTQDELRALVEEAVQKELAPLRQQLAESEARVRLRDVLGGIGYIAGIAGFYLLLRGGRGRSTR
jgi:nickel transport protein